MKAVAREIDIKTLSSKLSYCPASGEFRWIDAYHKVKIGEIAGTKNSRGYLVIHTGGVVYSAARLAWAFTHGSIPAGQEIDHMNRNRADNRLINLRLVTASENCRNRGEPKFYTKHRSGKFQAQIHNKYVGLYETPDAARAAALRAGEMP